MILSHDTTVFTTDPRFQVSPPSKTSTPVIRLFPGSLLPGSLSLSPALSLSDSFQVHFHFPGSLLPGLRHLGVAHLKAGGGGWR